MAHGVNRIVQDHFLLAKSVIGSGDNAVIVEPRAHAIRIKPRHGPEIFIPYAAADAVARAMRAYADATTRVRV